MFGKAIKNLLIFVAGASIGVAATWQFFKAKYEQIANEEIASVKDVYSKRIHEANISDTKPEVVEDKNDIQASKESEEVDDDKNDIQTNKESEEVDDEDINEYKKLASVYKNDEKEKGGEAMANEPYVIKPEEFGDSDYDLVSLNYYADKVLVDEDDNPIEDIDYLVGEDSLKHFGEYEDDSVFVRNDNLKTDFEILLVEEKYYSSEDDEE